MPLVSRGVRTEKQLERIEKMTRKLLLLLGGILLAAQAVVDGGGREVV